MGNVSRSPTSSEMCRKAHTAAPMAQLDQFSVSRLARRVDDVARALLEDLSPDDPRHGLYCCAMFVLLLVDEGRLFDVQNQAVLVASRHMEQEYLRHGVAADRLHLDIVVYCDCPHEEGAVAMVKVLRKHGARSARPLVGGLRGWESRGFPTIGGKNGAAAVQQG